MANIFWRLPIENADENTWAQYVLAQEKNSIGDYTSYLFNDAGVLKITPGRIGLDDGTNIGVAIIDTETTISMAGVSANSWAKIEMSVSGASVTFTALDLSGSVTSIPAGFKNAWNGTKGGFYISASKRTIGIARNTAGALAGVINQGYGYSYYGEYIGTTNTIEWEFNRGILNKTNIKEIGDWNMNSSVAGNASINVVNGISSETQYVRDVKVIIRNDADSARYPLNSIDASGAIAGGIDNISSTTGVYTLRAIAGELFDSVNFDSTGYNRGWLYEKMREET